jgi:hypothetical protein
MARYLLLEKTEEKREKICKKTPVLTVPLADNPEKAHN